MEDVVVDSNIIISYLVESDAFHQGAQSYIAGLENGEYTFHLPMLVPVEVTAVISRLDRIQNRLAILNGWQQTLLDWERDGNLALYPLDRSRMENAVNVAQQYRFKGADSIIAALAEELDLTLRTADGEILGRLERATP